MWSEHVRDRRLSAALSGVCLWLGACVSVQGEGFTAKYAGACASTPLPFAAGVVQDGPGAQAAKARLVEHIGDQADAFRVCYESALANVPRMHGRVVVRLSLNAQGGLDGLHVVENTTKYDAFGCCVADVVRKLTWPPFAAGAPVGLEYPFTFELVRMPLGYRFDLGSDFVNQSVRPEGYTLSLDGKMYGDP
jgi:hypothetical protein